MASDAHPHMKLVEDLVEKYQALSLALNELRPLLMKDPAPMWCPVPGASRFNAVESLLGHFNGDPALPAGVMCVSPDILPVVTRVNEAKDQFKATVMAMREAAAVKKTRIDRILTQLFGPESARPECLTSALRSTDLSRLDLMRTYTNVRVLPSPLRSISFTWSIGHQLSREVSVAEASEWVEALKSEEFKTMARNLLARLRPGEKLARVVELPNQLRANLTYHSEGGALARKSISIANVVLCPQDVLPQCVWREDPGTNTAKRLQRWDKKIDDQEYIPGLKLHLYRS